MTFQAYLDNVKAKTGKTPEDFKKLAAEKGLVVYKDVVAWLKSDFALGHGHANAIAHVILQGDEPPETNEEGIAKHFSGAKANWRKTYDGLIEKMQKNFGADITVSPTSSYLSILRKDRKFAVMQISSKRLDIGIKLKGTPPAGRFEEAGSWNNMVTHRVRIDDPDQIDLEVINWLQKAYDNA